MIIAIDGPAGSGKGTITKKIAEKLNLVNIDTGATYRAIAYLTLKNNISLSDKDSIIALSKQADIKFDNNDQIYIGDENITSEIRSVEVTNVVSQISSIKEVREILVELQRNMAKGKNVILEGRDITTHVFPNADYKFYLDATVEERTKRRYRQNKELGIDSSLEEIMNNIKMRDYNDTHKDIGSLKRTDDQIYIDSTDLSIDEVVDLIISYIKKDEEVL